jgi:hypothetical protein
MKFDPQAYGRDVGAILALDGNGERLMPLAAGRCSSEAALTKLKTVAAVDLFPHARAPEAALSGLYLYFSCLDQSHQLSQSIESAEGSFWHGILHRQEPDPDNARYWFRRVPSHPIFADLARTAAEIEARFPDSRLAPDGRWDPIRFVGVCERAGRESGSPVYQAALEMQRAEWQSLFDYCASGRSSAL